ncbi:MAG TPA: FkbM family methyltransferase [Chthoniobacterales bacterium]|jgi:FkbM family methyltransferase
MQKTLSYLKYMAGRYMKELNNPRNTYSQNSEDLVAASILGSVGRFIDVGSNDGITFSNTYLFANCGAAGLCFEPVKSNHWKARLFHLLHPRVKCINEGVSSRCANGGVVVDGYDGLLSYTISSDLVPGEKIPPNAEPVLLRPLSYWLSRYPKFCHLDLVSIDVEGHEKSVLESIDFPNFSAKCFIVETDKVSIDSINKILAPFRYCVRLTNDRNTFWFARGVAQKEDLYAAASRFNGYRVLE